MSKALATKNVAAVLAASVLALGLSFSFAAPAKADAVSDLQAQVKALLAQITALQGGQQGSQQVGGIACHTFTRNHKVGQSGGEIMWMQQFLNSVDGTQIATTGAGSPGNETSYFGGLTKAAVVRFQEKFASDILTPVGLTKGTGTWGPSSRAKANALCAGGTTGGTTGGGTTGGTVSGTGLVVTAATQPANSLAPAGASRVPFTTFTLTNNSGAAVTVTGVTVQRTGLAQDAAFSGVVLVDSNGLQVGVSHTFDSNHMTTVGETMTIAAGASQTFTVAGNISTTNASLYTGQVASITVTGINTTATVSGSLPITGAQQTINSTLTLGTVTPSNSSFDPVTAQQKNIGDTGIKFSGIRFTAGSAEDVKFYSLRWRVNGSVSASDLANVMTVVNGTSYQTMLSADGRYYTTVFPGGILIAKGNSVDAYVQGDIVGSNASGRQVEFDIDRTSDVYFVGQTYGYGIGLGTATGGTYSTSMPHNTGFNTASQPWFSGSTVTIQGGTVTTIQNATAVASQNVAVNVSNQVLGGFQTNFRGEAVTVQGMTFKIQGDATTTTSQITLVSIVDENGSVVAGPVDAVGNVLTYSNSVTFPVGLHTYTLKGKLPTAMTNNGTIRLSTDPSGLVDAPGWVNPQGQVSSNTVSLSGAGRFQMNVMTVRGATLSIAASPTPSAQNVVVGGQNVVFGNIQLDASQSGEDVRLSSIPVYATEGTVGDAARLSQCALFDGATQLNTGSNVLNAVAAGANNVTFDNSLTITKGSVKTLAVTCNLSSSATTGAGRSITIGVNSGSTFTATGLQSGSSLGANLVVTTTNSGTQTYSSGATLAVTVDSSSPSYAINAGGTTGVTVGVIKLRSTNEALNLNKIGLTLSASTLGAKSTGAGNAATGAGDLVQVYLYNSTGTLLGTATFVGANTSATSTLSSALSIARDVDTTIVVKADLAQVGVSSSGGIGNLIKVDPENFEGTGVSSGSTLRGGATAGVAGVRLFKSYPTVALDSTLGSTGIADGRLMRFKITANAMGSVGVSQFKFNLATSTITSVTNIALYGFTDSSYSSAISGQNTGGQIGSTLLTAGCTGACSSTASITTLTMAPSTNAVQVPAGQTYYFELRGSVAGVTTGSSVVTTLLADAAYITGLTSGYNVATSSAAATGNNFVWSGNSTTTSAFTDVDWSNGFSLPGLPSSGLIQTRSN